MAAFTNDDAPLDGGAIEDNRGEAAHRGSGGVFAGIRDPRFKAALYFALWGAAGVISTSVPSLAANPDHLIFYFLLFIAGVVLLLLTVAAEDVPRLERAADRLEARLRALL